MTTTDVLMGMLSADIAALVLLTVALACITWRLIREISGLQQQAPDYRPLHHIEVLPDPMPDMMATQPHGEPLNYTPARAVDVPPPLTLTVVRTDTADLPVTPDVVGPLWVTTPRPARLVRADVLTARIKAEQAAHQ